MEDVPKFTRGWQIAIVAALILPWCGLHVTTGDDPKAREIERLKQTVDQLEASVKKMVQYPYEHPRSKE